MASVNILFDEGSDTTLIREDFALKLGFRGVKKPMTVKGVGNSTQNVASREVELQLLLHDGNYMKIKAHTIPQVSSDLPKVNWRRVKNTYLHLRDLPLYTTGGRIDLLLGTDNIYLMFPYTTRSGSAKETCRV